MYLRKITHLFVGTRTLENQIDEFLDKVTEAGLVFEKAVASYLEDGTSEAYEDLLNQVQRIESRGDSLRRAIESELFVRTLIPDLRADVMTLLEDTDGIVNMFQATSSEFQSRRPGFPPNFTPDSGPSWRRW